MNAKDSIRFLTRLQLWGVLLVLMVSKAMADPIYYTMSQEKEAQKLAYEQHIPLVWLASSPECMTETTPAKNSPSDMTQMAVRYLASDAFRGKLVLICVNWAKEAEQLPDPVKSEFEHYDDGALQDNAYFQNPKLVFSTSDGKRSLGRLCNTEMQVDRERTIYRKLFQIFNDINAQAALLGMSVSDLKDARSKEGFMARLGLDPTKVAVMGFIVVAVLAIVGIIFARRSR